MVSTHGFGTARQTITMVVAPVLVVANTAITNQASFTALTTKRTFLGPAQTIGVRLTQSAPAIGALRVRVTGEDVAGRVITETSPSVSVVAKTTNYIYLSKVFAVVSAVEYLASSMSVGAELSVGVLGFLAKTNTGAVEHIAADNHGYHIPGMLPPVVLRAEGSLAGHRCDPDDPRFVHLQGYNHTTGRTFTAETTAGVIGRNVTGYQGCNDKIALDAAEILDDHDGTLYTAGDVLTVHLTTYVPEDARAI